MFSIFDTIVIDSLQQQLTAAFLFEVTALVDNTIKDRL